MLICASCGYENTAENRFCGACATPLGPNVSQAEERKVITVVFCDIVGSTALGEAMDTEALTRVMSSYFDRMRTVLRRHGGTVEKFIGDAVVAVFGYPTLHEDDALRAVRAAEDMRSGLKALNDELTKQAGVALQTRTGLNTGEVLIGALPPGSNFAAGDVMNTAARLQQLAAPGDILLGEATRDLVSTAVEAEPMEPVLVKGRTEQVRAWRLVKVLPWAEAHPRRLNSPMVGRQIDLGILTGSFEKSAQESTVELVTIVGEPGVGKTRLVAELGSFVDARPDRVRWRQGRCLPYGEAITFWALGEIVKAEAGIFETDPPDVAGAKIDGVIPDAHADAQWLRARLRPLVGLEAPDATREENFAAWRTFLEYLAEAAPSVFVFEDLHWADDGLLAFVEHLAEHAQGIPMLLVGTARPELYAKAPTFAHSARNSHRINLSPLSEGETATLIANLLARAILPRQVLSAILARSGGNPLYAEEFVRLVMDRGTLGEGGSTWTIDPNAAIAIPSGIQGLIAARFDTLSPERKQMLQDASVIGRVFWSGAIATMGDRDPEEVFEALHELSRKELVRPARPSSMEGQDEYTFHHDLVRDVCYGQIPRSRRADRHVSAASWIEEVSGERVEDFAEILAAHYVTALEYAGAAGLDTVSLVESAVATLDIAGQHALALNAAEEARRLSVRALELSASDDPRRPALLLRVAQANYWLGDFDIATAARAVEAVVATGDPEWAAEATALLAEYHFVRGELSAAMQRHADALQYVKDRPASGAKARVQSDYGRRLIKGGQDERGAAMAREALATAEEVGLDEVAANALMAIGMSRFAHGDERGIADLERTVELAARANAHDVMLRAHNNLANHLWPLGRLNDASEQLRLSRAAAERLGNVGVLRWLDGLCVWDLDLRGEWVEALQCADAFVAACDGSPHFLEWPVRMSRVPIYLSRGDHAMALADSEAVLKQTRATGDPMALQEVLVLSTRVLLATGRAPEAVTVLDELMATGPDLSFLGARGLASAMLRVDREQEFLRMAYASLRSPWLDAEVATAERRFDDAASIYEAIGARGDEAESRMAAAQAAAMEGRRAEADGQLSRALEFYRRVAATEYIRRCEALLVSLGN